MAITQITGVVTRVLPNNNNFFILPSNGRSLTSSDLDGHRVGLGEISANLLNARVTKIQRYPLPLPSVGDTVTLDLVDFSLPQAKESGPPSEDFGDGS